MRILIILLEASHTFLEKTIKIPQRWFTAKTLSQFFFCYSNKLRDNRKRRINYETEEKKKWRRNFKSVPTNCRLGYGDTTWGKLVTKLKGIKGWVAISSRKGKLFKRRFYVPWFENLDLVQKSKDKFLFGKKSLEYSQTK